MTREEAIKEIKSWDFLDEKETEAIHTLVPELKESDDERIRKEIINYILYKADGVSEEQEHSWIAYLEKQKEASKAIEAVERIDKYIDENLANAHDMKDSNPDKKYYRGWDDALGAMAEILQDVYSGEKQKETGIRWLKSDNVKNPDKPYIDKAGMFYTTDGRMCYASEIEKQKEQKPEPVFKVGDKIKLKSEPNYPYREIIDIKNGAYYFDEEVYLPFDNQDNWEKEQKSEDVTDIIYNAILEVCHTSDPKSFSEMNQTVFKVAQRVAEICQKSAEWSEDIIRKAVKEVGLTQYQINWFKSNVFPPKQEWSEEDENALKDLHKLIEFGYSKNFVGAQTAADMKRWVNESLRPQSKTELTLLDKNIIEAAVAFVEQNNHFNYWGGIDKHTVIKALRSLKPSWKFSEWSEEDKEQIAQIERIIKEEGYSKTIREKIHNWFDSLRPSWKPSEEEMNALKNSAYGSYQNGDGPILRELYEQLKKLM